MNREWSKLNKTMQLQIRKEDTLGILFIDFILYNKAVKSAISSICNHEK